MPSPERYRVLIPVLTARRAADLLRVGAALLRRRGGRGSLLGVVEVPHGQPISRGVTVARRYRSLDAALDPGGRPSPPYLPGYTYQGEPVIVSEFGGSSLAGAGGWAYG